MAEILEMSEWWEISISLASAVVALCALVVTVWQGRQNDRHNKMSVRPKLTASQDFENDDEGKIISFKLMNAGFGPAIIKDFILLYDGKEVSKNNPKAYQDFLKTSIKKADFFNIYSFAPESILLAGEGCELFSFRHRHGQDVSFIDKLNLRVNYQSIYEDELFVYDSKKDRLFQGREVRNA
jgi:hypothetical protein